MSPTILTTSATDTYEAGRRLGLALTSGALVLLYGELGMGKTVFVKGLAAGLDIEPDTVTSPTFTIVQRYEGRLALNHVDLYRLEASEVDDLGLEEVAERQEVIAIEWAERLPRSLGPAVVVRIEDLGGERRRLSMSEPCSRGTAVGPS